MFANAIRKTIGVHAVHPALEDGRHREPPQRELQDHRVSPAQFFLLGGDVGTLAAGGEGFARIQCRMERQRRIPPDVIVSIDLRLPLHGVQIGHLHAVAGALQALDREGLQGPVERGGFGVGVDKQNVHGGAREEMPATLGAAAL
ncbi:hypothetical protein D3C73_1342740 [compost metagenome]